MTQDDDALEAMAQAMKAAYGDNIRGWDITEAAGDGDNAGYRELKITVTAETEDEAASIAVRQMAQGGIRNHARFDDERHMETVMPEKMDGDKFVYTVIVRESL